MAVKSQLYSSLHGINQQVLNLCLQRPRKNTCTGTCSSKYTKLQKEIKTTVRMPDRSVICSCSEWRSPLFPHLLISDIFGIWYVTASSLSACWSLRKTFLKTVSPISNLKLNDVFSDVFGASSRSITEFMLAHPGKHLMWRLLSTATVKPQLRKFRPQWARQSLRE